MISLGHKENVTLQQVRTYTEMESHEEKLHKMIILSKINDTKDVMKRKAAEIEKSKVERKVERSFSNMASVSSGFGGGSGGGGGFFDDGEKPTGGGEFGGPRAPPQDDGFARGAKADSLPKSILPAKGMVLGKARPIRTPPSLRRLPSNALL